jgi:hypothetical protein
MFDTNPSDMIVSTVEGLLHRFSPSKLGLLFCLEGEASVGSITPLVELRTRTFTTITTEFNSWLVNKTQMTVNLSP